MTAVTVNVDGASRGNPGHAGIGVSIATNGQVIREYCAYIGQTTNNAAEYCALIKGLELAAELKATDVCVISDSELIVRQMNGRYKVKNPVLLPLYQEAQKRAHAFSRFSIRHVLRSENKAADRLANQGIERRQIAPEEATTPS